VESHRLRGWNYANTGYYFITIATAFREHIFGHVENDKMILNEIGEIVQNEFIKSFAIRSELSLGKFVLMPNHLHTIVGLENPHFERPCRDARPCVSTMMTTITPTTRPIPHRQPKSISSFVAGFKSATIQKINDWIDSMDSVQAHGIVETHGRASLQVDNRMVLQKYNRQNPLWQPNYHDRVIRNQREYTNIANYIIENPQRWREDRFFVEKT